MKRIIVIIVAMVALTLSGCDMLSKNPPTQRVYHTDIDCNCRYRKCYEIVKMDCDTVCFYTSGVCEMVFMNVEVTGHNSKATPKDTVIAITETFSIVANGNDWFPYDYIIVCDWNKCY